MKGLATATWPGMHDLRIVLRQCKTKCTRVHDHTEWLSCRPAPLVVASLASYVPHAGLQHVLMREDAVKRQHET